MATLHLALIFLMAIVGTATKVSGARLLPTTEEAKIASFCSNPNLECAYNTLINKATRNIGMDTSITRDKTIDTINDIQRDFFMESVLEEGNTLTLNSNLKDSALKRAFLTSNEAMTLPALTSGNAFELTRYLGMAPDSNMATAVQGCHIGRVEVIERAYRVGELSRAGGRACLP